jgi:hypothetical protein
MVPYFGGAAQKILNDLNEFKNMTRVNGMLLISDDMVVSENLLLRPLIIS